MFKKARVRTKNDKEKHDRKQRHDYSLNLSLDRQCLDLPQNPFLLSNNIHDPGKNRRQIPSCFSCQQYRRVHLLQSSGGHPVMEMLQRLIQINAHLVLAQHRQKLLLDRVRHLFRD